MPERQEYCCVENNTNAELFLTITYADNIINIEQRKFYELPVYEDGKQIGVMDPWSLRNRPLMKKETYVLRVVDDWAGVIFKFPLNRANGLPHLPIFRTIVEDFIIYDFYGNVIMTIEDINENTLKQGGAISTIAITPEMAENGRRKYNALPKFNGTVMNMPDSKFVVENNSGSPIIIIKHLGKKVVATDLNDWKIKEVYVFKYYENVDPMTLFYRWTKEMSICDADGNTIFTLNDIHDRFIRTVEGSETYGHRTYTLSITGQDIIRGIEKNKNIAKIDIEKELENIKKLREESAEWEEEYPRRRIKTEEEKDEYYPLHY
jgi:hypothetical protein